MRFVICLIFIAVVFTLSIVFFKGEIVRFFEVNNHRSYELEPDLIVVLEGGSIAFLPTLERVNQTVRVYIENSAKILLCSTPSLRKEIIDYLVMNGVQRGDIVISEYVYDSGGGTINNIKEILSVIKKNKDYINIKLVTSPYHELRVDIIFSQLLKKSGIKQHVNMSFSRIVNSDIENTDIKRFLRIITHELLGVLDFEYKLMVNGI